MEVAAKHDIIVISYQTGEKNRQVGYQYASSGVQQKHLRRGFGKASVGSDKQFLTLKCLPAIISSTLESSIELISFSTPTTESLLESVMLSSDQDHRDKTSGLETRTRSSLKCLTKHILLQGFCTTVVLQGRSPDIYTA